MWSKSIEILDPVAATDEFLRREAERQAIPVLHESTWLTRLIRRLKYLIGA